MASLTDTHRRHTDDSQPAYWLVVERYDNWVVDQADGFRVYGFSEGYKKTAESLRRGDVLIVYVAKARSALADCRRVISERPTRTLESRWSGELYPFRIATEPILTLPFERWVRVPDLAAELEMTRGKSDWRHVVRQPVRRIPAQDAKTMIAAMELAALR